MASSTGFRAVIRTRRADPLRAFSGLHSCASSVLETRELARQNTHFTRDELLPRFSAIIPSRTIYPDNTPLRGNPEGLQQIAGGRAERHPRIYRRTDTPRKGWQKRNGGLRPLSGSIANSSIPGVSLRSTPGYSLASLRDTYPFIPFTRPALFVYLCEVVSEESKSHPNKKNSRPFPGGCILST